MPGVVMVRSFCVDGDSRFLKMSRRLEQGNDVYKIIWTRGHRAAMPADTRTLHCTLRARQGARWRSALHFFAWNVFVFFWILRLRKKIGSIHAVDFDTAIPCLAAAKLLRLPLVYECFDVFCDSRLGWKPAVAFFRFAEALVARIAALVVLPHERRIEQLGHFKDKIRAKTLVIENIPGHEEILNSLGDWTAPPRRVGDRLRIVYVGTLEPETRALELIPELARQNPEVEFVVAGNGALSGMFERSSTELENLEYLGYVPYRQGLQLMAAADLVFAFYLTRCRNHAFAAPNKFYEHLALGRPLITNPGTPVADLANSIGSGLVVDASVREIGALVERLNAERPMLMHLGHLAAAAWRTDYMHRLERQYADYIAAFTRVCGNANRCA